MKRLRFYILLLLLGVMMMPGETVPQRRLVKILVSTPYITEQNYLPVADVMSGTIIRELKRVGGIEIIDREKSEEYIVGQGGSGWVATREQAVDVGDALGADIVIYSALRKEYNSFYYHIGYIEVKRNILQQVIKGSFLTSISASEIGRLMKEEIEKFQKFIPLPSELDDPGSVIRQVTVDPGNLPKSAEIDNFPPGGRNGMIEQIFTYYRIFPGEMEYKKIAGRSSVMNLMQREQMDEELTKRYNQYNLYGDFAIRHNLQAFYIRNCSAMAINVLLANKIPVLLADDMFLGYFNMLSDGFCIYKTLSNRAFDTTDLTHRDRLLVFFIVPYPGRKGGISKDYLASAISRYKDEWGETPELVEYENGIFDLGTSAD